MFSILSMPPFTLLQQENLQNQKINVLEAASQLQVSAAVAVKLGNKE
uniref:HTH psq-type domain-containing protein n=1 Tax=Meloidogyne floridensis TaxID=298350 RepID=A0A915P711_9BILA